MIDTIVSRNHPITLVGGGESKPEDLYIALNQAPICVAVDGGVVPAMAAGVDIVSVIGDFDSIPADLLASLPPALCQRITEQDSTDFEKALTRVEAPLLIGVGFLGGRVDHQLAAFHTLLRFADRPCILLGATEIICLAPPHLSLPTEEGEVVSLFPLTDVTGRSTGLAWPIDGLHMGPEARSGTSNQALGPMTLDVDAPGLLLILPRRLISALGQALLQPQAARWPARAE